MSIDIKKLNPWNWFKHEDENTSRNVAIQRGAPPSGYGRLPSPFAANPLWNMHREVDRLFDSLFSQFGTGLPNAFSDAGVFGILRPNVDIKETKNDYQITVEVPGVEENDVKLELTNGALTVKGEKRHEKAEDGENYSCIERSYGSFCRTLSLPADANEDGVEAKFKSGVLTITVPRKQIAKPKNETKVIDIKRAA